MGRTEHRENPRSISSANDLTSSERRLVTAMHQLGYGPKKQITELFAYVRGVEAGVIQVLEIRGGLPFFMEIPTEPAESR